MSNDAIVHGCKVLASLCADLKADEQALIVSEPVTKNIADILAKECSAIASSVHHLTIPALTMHGAEPEGEVAHAMSTADVIFGLTRMSMAHSQARKSASDRGARYLSLPDYSEEIFNRRALLANFRGFSELSKKVADLLSNASVISIQTLSGTRLTCSSVGRVGNAAPGWCDGPGTLASPPDAESNVALLESKTSGILVVDGSIPHPVFGVLEDPITLTINEGRVVQIKGPRSEELTSLFDRSEDIRSRVVAEFGIGLNDLATLCGSMLEDEGTLGTVHFGIGSNSTIGGINKVPFHLDHVIKNPTVTIDGQRLMTEGRFEI